MKTRTGVLLLACAVAVLLPLPSSVGQEGGGEPARAHTGSGIRATVIQLEGRTDRVEDILFKNEQLGILSLTKVPASAYVLRKGRATVTVPIRKIGRIDIDGERVRIAGVDGSAIEGDVDKQSRFFLTGKVSFGDFEVDMAHVKSVEFTHPKGADLYCEACNRLYENAEWKFCPIDGARLKAAE